MKPFDVADIIFAATGLTEKQFPEQFAEVLAACEMVVAQEREACALIAEHGNSIGDDLKAILSMTAPFYVEGRVVTSTVIAHKIRARGKP